MFSFVSYASSFIFDFMTKRFVLCISVLFFANTAKTQSLESFEHVGEIGVSVGAAHYFGDLNPEFDISRPKFSAALHYTKQMNNYVGLKISATYAGLGYADKYSKNVFQQNRNLSFNSDVWEFSLNGTFNFFSFNPGFEGNNYTPYVGLGIGVFTYDPYAYLNGEKYLLRTVGTEGQGSDAYPDRLPYKNYAFCMPLTLGFKYAFSPSMNVFTELRYRFTNTDYLDDVSTTYTPDAFIGAGPASLLSDRSYELGSTIGIKGRQRGTTLQKDAFATFHVGLSFNLQAYRCPNQKYSY
ncbi:MAG: DUF6089 family protein [Chitinophagaceae bacterium]